MTDHDEFKKLIVPEGQSLHACPICGSEVELWQHSEAFDSPTSKAVMCGNNSMINGIEDLECLLFMPPHNFYCATAKSAIEFWNTYAQACEIRRKENLKSELIQFDPKEWHKYHHKDCGTAYRGCGPKCPKDHYEEELIWICYKAEHGYTTDQDECV